MCVRRGKEAVPGVPGEEEDGRVAQRRAEEGSRLLKMAAGRPSAARCLSRGLGRGTGTRKSSWCAQRKRPGCCGPSGCLWLTAHCSWARRALSMWSHRALPHIVTRFSKEQANNAAFLGVTTPEAPPVCCLFSLSMSAGSGAATDCPCSYRTTFLQSRTRRWPPMGTRSHTYFWWVSSVGPGDHKEPGCRSK